MQVLQIWSYLPGCTAGMTWTVISYSTTSFVQLFCKAMCSISLEKEEVSFIDLNRACCVGNLAIKHDCVKISEDQPCYHTLLLFELANLLSSTIPDLVSQKLEANVFQFSSALSVRKKSPLLELLKLIAVWMKSAHLWDCSLVSFVQ